ncbi:hypothetical protein CTheo_6393 [Ceratobasidium theobromae]|uniref:Uncharacterized protein n=1 Tax=Ceratobasidium theobromae TaxID=1582974 RepID=A0A5N5QEK2_9AGAM|nr:hypothetical protein CTheo_6393 [Ceratobasidium theobromae]
MAYGMTMVHTTTAAHPQGPAVTGARSVPRSALSQSPIPSRVRCPLASSSASLLLGPSCVGPGGELAWRAAPAAPRPYARSLPLPAPSRLVPVVTEREARPKAK